MTTPVRGARTPKGAEPARADREGAAEEAAAGVPAKLLFVTAGLAADGGGIAAAGRLLLDRTLAWAGARDIRVRVLSLGESADLPAGVEGTAFVGDQARLASAVWRAQLFEGFGVHLYDFLGVARIQGVLPAPLRAHYLLYLWGIECWRTLRGSRRRALHGASRLLACSAHTIERLRRANPDAPPIEPVALALEPPQVAPRTEEIDEPLLAAVGDGFLLIVGRMAPGERYKGHDELLAALAGLSDAHPSLRLVVAGEGDDRPRLEAEARRLGVADRVTFTGFVTDATLTALYERCAALVMPSSGEGFGLVYLEAMRAGKPCIALAGSAAEEIVVDGVTGVLTRPGVEPLAAAVAGLLADPDRLAAMGAAGQRRYHHHFDADSFAARLEPHLDALMARVYGAAPGRAGRDDRRAAPVS